MCKCKGKSQIDCNEHTFDSMLIGSANTSAILPTVIHVQPNPHPSTSHSHPCHPHSTPVDRCSRSSLQSSGSQCRYRIAAFCHAIKSTLPHDRTSNRGGAHPCEARIQIGDNEEDVITIKLDLSAYQSFQDRPQQQDTPKSHLRKSNQVYRQKQNITAPEDYVKLSYGNFTIVMAATNASSVDHFSRIDVLTRGHFEPRAEQPYGSTHHVATWYAIYSSDKNAKVKMLPIVASCQHGYLDGEACEEGCEIKCRNAWSVKTTYAYFDSETNKWSKEEIPLYNLDHIGASSTDKKRKTPTASLKKSAANSAATSSPSQQQHPTKLFRTAYGTRSTVTPSVPSYRHASIYSYADGSSEESEEQSSVPEEEEDSESVMCTGSTLTRPHSTNTTTTTSTPTRHLIRAVRHRAGSHGSSARRNNANAANAGVPNLVPISPALTATSVSSSVASTPASHPMTFDHSMFEIPFASLALMNQLEINQNVMAAVIAQQQQQQQMMINANANATVIDDSEDEEIIDHQTTTTQPQSQPQLISQSSSSMLTSTSCNSTSTSATSDDASSSDVLPPTQPMCISLASINLPQFQSYQLPNHKQPSTIFPSELSLSLSEAASTSVLPPPMPPMQSFSFSKSSSFYAPTMMGSSYSVPTMTMTIMQTNAMSMDDPIMQALYANEDNNQTR